MRSSSSSFVKSPRSVSFHGKVLVRGVLHRNDYKDDEVHACWYDRAEMSRIRSCARSELKLFLQEEPSDSCSLRISGGEPEFCLQGLEGFTKLGMEQKLLRRREAIRSVLDTQHGLYDRFGYITNPNDMNVIARVYKVASETSERIARVKGINSEREMSELWKADQCKGKWDYMSRTISAVRCEFALINESRKLRAQTGWTNISSKAA
jgi:hypothetical protein